MLMDLFLNNGNEKKTEKVSQKEDRMNDKSFLNQKINCNTDKFLNKPLIINKFKPLSEIINLFFEKESNKNLYVTDENGHLISTINLNIFMDTFFNFSYDKEIFKYNTETLNINIHSLLVDDIIFNDSIYLLEEMKVSDALILMKKKNLFAVPLVTQNLEILGEISFINILKNYQIFKKDNIA